MSEYGFHPEDDFEEEVPPPKMELPSDLPETKGLTFPYFERLKNEIELVDFRQAFEHDTTDGVVLPDFIQHKMWVKIPDWSQGLEGISRLDRFGRLHGRIQLTNNPRHFLIDLAGLKYDTPEREQKCLDQVIQVVKKYLDSNRDFLKEEMPPERLQMTLDNIGKEIDALENKWKAESA